LPTTRRRLDEIRSTLPAGLHADNITDQARSSQGLKKVGQVFVETVVIVLGVVMLFLGWRSGLVTGTIVPMTVLGTVLIMNWMGIELHQISIAAIIIALGIFVDNGIVVVEDYQRRIAEGEDAPSARARRARRC
jgi:multidrug efflux pump subunit AcrB